MQGLTQQLPALLHLVGGHVVQARVIGILLVSLGELRIELLENRVVGPCFARWPRLGELRQPQLQALMPWIGGEQPVYRGGAGAGQAGDKDRPLDGDIDVLRVLLPRGLGQQPGHQRVADEEPGHLAAEFGEIGVAPVGLEQHAECFAIVVVVGAEVVETHRLGGRRVQLVDGADVGPGRHQALYSPQLTSRVCPVMPLDRSLAMNRIAEATSSSVGSRLRSDFAAVAS